MARRRSRAKVIWEMSDQGLQTLIRNKAVKTITGEPFVYTNWLAGEPNNGDPDDDFDDEEEDDDDEDDEEEDKDEDDGDGQLGHARQW